VHFVPLASNYGHLEDVARLCEKLGVERISVLRFVPHGRGASGEVHALSPGQNMALRDSIERLRAQGRSVRTGSPFNVLLMNTDPVCNAGVDRLTIGPDLRVFPCDAFKHVSPGSLGVDEPHPDLVKTSLFACWSASRYLAAVRALVLSQGQRGTPCGACRLYSRCGSGCVGQKIASGGDPASPEPACLRDHVAELGPAKMGGSGLRPEVAPRSGRFGAAEHLEEHSAAEEAATPGSS